MDFAFVPGTTEYEDFLKRVMKSRKNTTLIDDAKVKTVHDFFQKLKDTALVADNLLLGAHASDQTFAIPFDDNTSATPVDSNGRDFEKLLVLDTNGRIRIPLSIRKDDTDLHLKGCNVGADRTKPFITLLKHALDNPRHVTAPKFVHSLHEDPGRGVLEYLKYDYEIVNATAFKTHDELIEAFKKGNLIEGTFKQGVEVSGSPVDVPAANWKDLVQTTLDLKPTSDHEVAFGISTKVDPPVGKIKVVDKKNATCKSRVETYTAFKQVSGPMPPDDAGKMAFLKDAILDDRRMKPGHLFPLNVRYGYPTLDTLMKGMTWTVTAKDTLLTFLGSHYVYSLYIPIVKTGTNKLIYNYYPTTGTPKINFAEDNATFVMFGIE
jgi:hypothetical protein